MSGIVWRHMMPSGNFWERLAPLRTVSCLCFDSPVAFSNFEFPPKNRSWPRSHAIRRRLGACSRVWMHLGNSGGVWARLGAFANVGGLLAPSGRAWDVWTFGGAWGRERVMMMTMMVTMTTLMRSHGDQGDWAGCHIQVKSNVTFTHIRSHSVTFEKRKDF